MPELLIDKIARLESEIAQAEAQRALVAQGRAVIEATRDGRTVRYTVPTLEQLEAHIRILRGELVAAQAEAGIGTRPRRTAIGGYYG